LHNILHRPAETGRNFADPHSNPNKPKTKAIAMPFSTDQSRLHATRLLPGQDLRDEIEKLCVLAGIHAGFVLSAVGSLTKVSLRLANQTDPHVMEGHFEIVSLTGTTGPHGVHLHMAVSDSKGVTTGGHVTEGCIVFTTVELVIGEALGLVFHRETDPHTTFKELSIHPAQ
jgi:predicted DNA-binding protein with PD1-like motif